MQATQGGLTQEQYQAMSTEQQAAYWEQWNQYYAHYYQQPVDAQQYAGYGHAHSQQPYQVGAEAFLACCCHSSQLATAITECTLEAISVGLAPSSSIYICKQSWS